jgi:hypothetical protein
VRELNSLPSGGRATMRLSVKKLAVVLSLGMVGVGSSALAGYTHQNASCVKNADGSGYCFGNFLGFREHAISSTYAWFSMTETGSKTFVAHFTPSGAPSFVTYTCVPDATVAAMWPQAMAHRGHFRVDWNTSGTCTELSLTNGSQYSNY